MILLVDDMLLKQRSTKPAQIVPYPRFITRFLYQLIIFLPRSIIRRKVNFIIYFSTLIKKRKEKESISQKTKRRSWITALYVLSKVTSPHICWDFFIPLCAFCERERERERGRERDGEHFCSVQATVMLGNEASRDETPKSGNRARNHNEYLGP